MISTGYCTNVHAGADLATTQAELERHAVDVRNRLGLTGDLGIGLWLSAASAKDLLESNGVDRFAEWLQDRRLKPFTLNGFPFGDFHQPIVKHKVYLPTWADPQRLDFTKDLVTILDGLLPQGERGTISTLPLMWGSPPPDADQMRACADQLLQLAQFLQELEDRTGRWISLCLEPEPGCALTTSQDVVSLFDRYLLADPNQGLNASRYLQVCHDVCHAVVMFEPQLEVLQRYQSQGISVGKVQVSSAICVDWERLESDQARQAALAQVTQFAEDRYLHQTCVLSDTTGNQPKFYEDLPDAIASHQDDLSGEWRIHFHVPVYLESFGPLHGSRGDIESCIPFAARELSVEHFEVETYAWNVLPHDLQHDALAEGIAAELAWFDRQCVAPLMKDDS